MGASSTKQLSNQIIWHFFLSFGFRINLASLKSDRVSDLTPVIPGIQDFFPGVVIYHGVELILVCELYVGVPLFSCLGVISKVDSSRIGVIAVNAVDNSTGHKRIAHLVHCFCPKSKKQDKHDWVEFTSDLLFCPPVNKCMTSLYYKV